MPTQPNILLIHSDQHRFDSLGVNGHPVVKTPHLDSLARDGVNFTHAFTPAPICTPARASLLSGTFPVTHGCLSIPGADPYKPGRADLPLWSRLLHHAGYRQALVGRYHQEFEGDPYRLGFDDYVSISDYGHWRKAQHLPDPPRGSGFMNYFGSADPHVTPEQSRIGWTAQQVSNLMGKYCSEGRPFVVRWDPPEPHLPCVPPEPFASMYAPASIPPWPSFHDTLENKPRQQMQQRLNWHVEGWTWQQWAPTVAAYFGEISLIDDKVGMLLAKLDELGIRDNTLVIYCTDHGDFCGGHGQLDKHFAMYDDITRVPLIAHWPGRLDGGKTCDAFVSSELDIAWTLVEAAGLPIPRTFEGRSLIAAASGSDPNPRQDIYASWHGAQFGNWSQRMLRNRRWKYVWNLTEIDELYDLDNDPGELINRVHDKACRDALHDCRRRLVTWMEQLGDRALNRFTREQLTDHRQVGEA